ncbi:hypothetical protein OUZ56_005715 [Daphnia magna]|uniref:Uncharacterized protein n=1 Tax=Daphnia magna TaxID=35525 RepID=A0ABQ9YUX8_9CRUS|nr:hypothetical protein OUZ56_005715 [Daphnia magna]
MAQDGIDLVFGKPHSNIFPTMDQSHVVNRHRNVCVTTTGSWERAKDINADPLELPSHLCDLHQPLRFSLIRLPRLATFAALDIADRDAEPVVASASAGNNNSNDCKKSSTSSIVVNIPSTRGKEKKLKKNVSALKRNAPSAGAVTKTTDTPSSDNLSNAFASDEAPAPAKKSSFLCRPAKLNSQPTSKNKSSTEGQADGFGDFRLPVFLCRQATPV